MFSSDLRQILPVIPRGTRADAINARIKSSHLWKDINCLKLENNMRTQYCMEISICCSFFKLAIKNWNSYFSCG